MSTIAVVTELARRLAATADVDAELAALDDAARIDLITTLERLACSARATQAVVSADFATSRRAAQAARGVPQARQSRGLGAQVGLARRESPTRGSIHLGLAVSLATELPHTMAAFRAGAITEWKATLVARETACLSLDDRLAVDADIAGDPSRLEAMGDAELTGALRRAAYLADPASVVERRRRAEAERRVSLRPVPDTMTQLSALLPVKDGVAVYASLTKAADQARAAGDTRSRGQVMADTLVERVTGRAAGVTVTVDLVVSDAVLLGDPADDDDIAFLGDHGITGDLARRIVADEQTVLAGLRRVYATPATGALVGLDSVARTFPTGLARLIRLRDRRCRTPWCDAPIRHTDHVQSVDQAGATTFDNGQGLCEACNYAKQAHGWSAQPRPGPRHGVETTTPTGHTHTTSAPRAPDTISASATAASPALELYYGHRIELQLAA